MRKNINKTILLVALIAIMCIISGCQKMDVGVTYNVITGDRVTVYCADKELKFRPELPFSVLEGKTTLAQGNFITLEQYDAYLAGLKNADETVTIHQDETIKDNITYIFYSVTSETGNEHDYIIKINGSNTALVFGSTLSKEAAEKAFNAIKFQIQK